MKVTINDVGIKAISVVVPKQKRGYDDLAKIVSEKDARRICQNTGIDFVRVSKEGETAADLCELAARKILEKEDINTITGLIFVSQTPDYKIPATSCVLQHKLGLPSTTVCYDVNSGCTAFIKGLHLASMIASTTHGDVLLLVGDTMTKHVSSKDHSLYLLMGDAGSAALISQVSGKNMEFNLQTYGEKYSSLIIPAGGNRLPSSSSTSEVVECEKGNWRSQEHLYMDGMAIMLFALSKVTSLVEEEIKGKQSPPNLYVFHQANEFIVNSMTKNLKLDFDKRLLTVKEYGNTGPASIPLAICDSLSTDNSIYQRDSVLMVGFGIGLAIATVLTNLADTLIYPVLEV